MKRALSVAESLSHAGSILHATEIALMFHQFRQDVDEVENLAERMIALSREEEFAALEVKGQLFESPFEKKLSENNLLWQPHSAKKNGAMIDVDCFRPNAL